MKKSFLLLILIILPMIRTVAQDAFAVKKWNGRYPTMNNDYPLSFVCWKGWLPPVPHFFVRIYPSHYYYYLNSIPAYDTKGYVDMGLYQGLKLIIKELDSKTISRTLEEITGIQTNQLGQAAIERVLRDSRLVKLPDVLDNQYAYLKALDAFDYLNNPTAPGWLSKIFEEEIQLKAEALQMIYQMDCSQGDKLKAGEDINRELRQLRGTMLYAAQKIRYWQQMNQMKENHLGFLTR